MSPQSVSDSRFQRHIASPHRPFYTCTTEHLPQVIFQNGKEFSAPAFIVQVQGRFMDEADIESLRDLIHTLSQTCLGIKGQSQQASSDH